MLQIYIVDLQLSTQNDGRYIIKHFFKITHEGMKDLHTAMRLHFQILCYNLQDKKVFAKILHP